MKILFITLCLFGSYITPYFAQAPDTIWTKTYGIPGCALWAVELQKTFDNGYIIFGESSCSPSANDSILLIRTDSFGNLQWMDTYGGVQYTAVHSGKQTSDSGYVVTGSNFYGGNDYNIYLLKINKFDDSTWFQNYVNNAVEAAYSVQQTMDGGYILTGIKFPGEPILDLYVIKTDSLGNITWTKTYGSIESDWGYSIELTSDSGYVITGKIGEFVCLIKINSQGDTIFIKEYFEGVGYQVKETYDKGYIVTGYHFSNIFLIKTNQIGDTLWTLLWDETTAIGRSVCTTSDSGYIVVGYGYFGLGDRDIFIAKVNKNGQKLWKKIMGGPFMDWGYSVLQNEDDSYTIVGNTTYNFGTEWNILLIKLAPDTGIVTVNYNSDTIEDIYLSQNYPNPFNPNTIINYNILQISFVTIKVYDVLGNEITTLVNEEKPAGEYNVEFRVDNLELSSGIYFYQLRAGQYVETKKMVLLK